MKCEYCENEVPANMNHCPACGAYVSLGQIPECLCSLPATENAEAVAKNKERSSLSEGMMFCTNCGTVVSVNAVQCSKCGEPLRKVPCTGSKQRFVFILLALFLGLFGVHDFYAGYIGRGIAQLLCTLIIGWLIIPIFIQWIFILIELCTVTVDSDGNPFV